MVISKNVVFDLLGSYLEPFPFCKPQNYIFRLAKQLSLRSIHYKTGGEIMTFIHKTYLQITLDEKDKEMIK
ncbi:hypothetical protein CN404_29555, partial [Bacillus thuringiensis]